MRLVVLGRGDGLRDGVVGFGTVLLVLGLGMLRGCFFLFFWGGLGWGMV